jgi:cupin 2 domain-containing protein
MQGKLSKQNFYNGFNLNGQNEIYENFLSGKIFSVERIISKGYKTSEKEWLVSKNDEWVILLKGKARVLFFEDTELELNEGDFINIPKNTKHKVTFTSKRPECFWLAIHYKNK